MHTKVAKWGNSLAVRLPARLANEVRVEEGDHLDVQVVDGAFVLTPRPDAAESLEELLDKLDPTTLHGEVDWGPPVGKEVW